ncbi:MAG: 3-deoxy-D-manno-octulosonic acid transferase [Candidatus Omnitrophica bacterium]|nr:3-deoxy-D-manno-octulosonic acid transferase [Candidatus Omnitrophota bacterium]
MLYDIGFLIFSVIYLPILVFKGKLHGEFPERFGRYAPSKERVLLSGRDRIWIQAVSVGEAAVCKSLIPLLKEKFPGHDLVVSTITKAGNDLAKRLFSKDAMIIYFPLDFGFAVKRALKYIKPAIYIMIETEIWPNLLNELSRNSIPSVMINGRISDRSIGKYRLVKPFLKTVLSKISSFCMQDTIDAERVVSLGAPSERVKVTGNMKFDAEIPADAVSRDVVRRSLGLNGEEALFVAGSTHEGEEEIIVEAFKELIFEFPKLRLLIAPRHINRVENVEKIIKKSGFEPARVSLLNGSCLPGKTQDAVKAGIACCERRILVLDTIGHLNEAYSAATLVFIGGSLIEHGGQNPVEPAVLGRPILFGPHMFNFKYITKTLLKEGAALQVTGKEDLVNSLRTLLNDPLKRSGLGDNAKRVTEENRGATKKNLEEISEILR